MSKELTLEERIRLSDENEKICDRVSAGEQIPCPECGAILVEVTPWGVSEWADKNRFYPGHGVFCPENEEHFGVYEEYNLKKRT